MPYFDRRGGPRARAWTCPWPAECRGLEDPARWSRPGSELLPGRECLLLARCTRGRERLGRSPL
eukprot:14622151-Heterocapsa_arctica.AAC.1